MWGFARVVVDVVGVRTLVVVVDDEVAGAARVVGGKVLDAVLGDTTVAVGALVGAVDATLVVGAVVVVAPVVVVVEPGRATTWAGAKEDQGVSQSMTPWSPFAGGRGLPVTWTTSPTRLKL